MGKAASVKVISVDLYGTVVDIRDSLAPIWRTFLGSNFSDDVVKNYWDRATEILREKLLNAAKGETGFKNMRGIFEDALAGFFSEIHMDFDARLGAEMWMRGHELRNIYPDAKLFLAGAGQKFPVCLSSECDLEMIAGVGELYSFDTIFYSEKLRCYKLNPRFWSHIIQHYSLPPDNVLHVGDATSDVVGPAKRGILTCWLNRHGRKWDHDVKPDFEVTSLSQILEILGLK
jgi:putative hydrolase of the HAD superfamily